MKKSKHNSHFDEKFDIEKKKEYDDEEHQSNKKQKTEDDDKNDTKMILSKLYELSQNEKQMEDYLRKEFEEIEKKTHIINQNANYYSANLSENSKKNRYIDILPLEKNRVVLAKRGTISGDYINANFIDGAIENSKKRFIATQGPLTNSIEDFWHMIWDEDVKVIVMLVNLKDSNGTERCAKYWPNYIRDTIYTFDDLLKITLDLEEKLNANIIKREFTIIHGKSKETKKVTQIHFLSWPDRGVLDSCDAFMELSKSVDLTDFTKDVDDNDHHNPIVVHCSAGVGRTGVYIVIHNVLQKLIDDVKKSSTSKENEITIDVPSILLQLREQRSHCVQTLEQYIFCYKTIYHASKIILQLK